MTDSGCFKELIYQQCICHITYNIDDYLALLSTLSPYIKLEAQQRADLLMNLKKTLENMGYNSISLSYLSAFHLAQKV